MKEVTEFSLTPLLVVTGFCFFGFGGVVKFFEIGQESLFFRIGMISMSAGIISWASLAVIRGFGRDNETAGP